VKVAHGPYGQVALGSCGDSPTVIHADATTYTASVRCCTTTADCGNSTDQSGNSTDESGNSTDEREGGCPSIVQCASGIIETRHDSLGSSKMVRRCFPTSATRAKALAVCLSIGQKLPETLQELQTGCGSGCRSDDAHFWLGGMFSSDNVLE
jgi:hypothetical protein